MAKDETDTGPPDTAARRRMNQVLRRLQPGTRIFVRTAEGRERELDVVGRGTPEWMADDELAEDQTGRVLEGYGTTYLIQSYNPNREDGFPWLHWPSREDGVAVWNVCVVDEDRPIDAEKTAVDLLWRVEESGGR